jgi:hypothetical protein
MKLLVRSVTKITTSTYFLSRILFFSGFLFFAANMSGQISFFNQGNAAYLQKENLVLNSLIKKCLINGDYTVALDFLKKKDPKTTTYRIGNALLMHAVEGKQKSIAYLDEIYKKDRLAKEEGLYLKSMVNLLTDNLDDYHYYLNKIDSSSVFWIRLKLKELNKKNKFGYREEEKKELLATIDSYLATDVISVSDRVFLELTKIDIADNSSEKFEKVLAIWKKNPQEFDEKKLSSYLEECKSSACSKVREKLQSKGGLSFNNSKSPSFNDRQNWKTFGRFIENNPLFNSTIGSSWVTVPPLKSLENYKEAKKMIDDLQKKYPYNYSIAKWKFWISFQDTNFYKLDAIYAASFLRQLINIFSLNQSEGHPEGKNTGLNNYIYDRNLAGSDEKILTAVQKELSLEKFEAIVKYLEDKMQSNPRNKNLRTLHIKMMEVSTNAKKYFKSYLKGIQFIKTLPNMDLQLAREGAKDSSKKELLLSYRATKNLGNHGDLIPFYIEHELIKEAANIMVSYIGEIPFPPNKEHFFMKYYNSLISNVSDADSILESLKTIHAKNKNVGLITLYIMIHELISGDVKEALSILESTKLTMYSADRMKKAFTFLKGKNIGSEPMNTFMNQFNKKYPEYQKLIN